ncbi:MAG: hypothetical protein P8123_10815, partial [bacterium]
PKPPRSGLTPSAGKNIIPLKGFSDIFKAYFWSNGCHAIEPVVALYDLKMSENPFRGMIFFPADGVSPERGGFGSFYWEIIATREYSTWFSSLRYFRSLEGLRRSVEALMTTPAGKRGTIKAYVSTSVDRKKVDEALRGLNYRCDEVAYFAQEWRSRIPVYKLVIYGRKQSDKMTEAPTEGMTLVDPALSPKLIEARP